jgi:Class III cytochrome C family
MKRILVSTAFILAVSWLVMGALATSSSADEKSEQGYGAPEKEIIIEGEKKSARFPHSVHLDLGVVCSQCHHDSNHQPLTDKEIAALESSEQLLCQNCHNKDFANDKLQSLKEVFHARCKECHKQGVNGKTGPTKCTACHVK